MFVFKQSSDPPFFKGVWRGGGEGVNFDYLIILIIDGESEKLKKPKGVKYGAGAGLLKKREGWHFPYLFFSKFIIFTFS